MRILCFKNCSAKIKYRLIQIEQLKVMNNLQAQFHRTSLLSVALAVVDDPEYFALLELEF